MKNTFVALIVAAMLAASPVAAQSPETVLVNGKVVTVDSQFSIRQAIAIRDGKITVTGSTADVQKLAGPATRVIDLQGRTVIPGLIDSHLHAIRAALSFSTEVNWIGAPSLTDALGRIKDAVQPGRRIATLRHRGLELSVATAFISAYPRRQGS